jgi:hypothetical protein
MVDKQNGCHKMAAKTRWWISIGCTLARIGCSIGCVSDARVISHVNSHKLSDAESDALLLNLENKMIDKSRSHDHNNVS